MLTCKQGNLGHTYNVGLTIFQAKAFFIIALIYSTVCFNRLVLYIAIYTYGLKKKYSRLEQSRLEHSGG